MSFAIQDRTKNNLLHWGCFAVGLINLAAVFWLVTINQSKAVQEQVFQRQANIWRINTLLQLDVKRTFLTGKAWVYGLSKPDPQVIQQLESWYSQDIDTYQRALSGQPDSQDYIEMLRPNQAIFFSAIKALGNSLPAKNSVVEFEIQEQKNSTIDFSTAASSATSDQSLKPWITFSQSQGNLTQVLSEGLKDHDSKLADAVEKYIYSSQNKQYLIIALLCLDCLSILLLSVAAVWGPSWALGFMREKSKILHKFSALVAIPLLTQLLLYTTLGVLIADASRDLTRNEKFVTSEDEARKLQWTTFHALGAGEPLSGNAVQTVLTQLNNFAATNTHNFLVQHWLQEVKNDYLAAVTLKPHNTQKLIPRFGQPYEHERYFVLCERIFNLERLSLPSVGQQHFWQRRRELLTSQAASFENMLILVGISLLLQVILCVTLLRFFIQAVESRFRKVQNNIENYAYTEVFPEPLFGSDEAAELSQFLTVMAQRIDEAKKHEQSMVENASDPIFSLSSDWRILQTNAATASIFASELTSSNKFSLLSLLQPDDRRSIQAQLLQIRQSSKSSIFECRLSGNNQPAKDYLVSAQWSDADQQYFCVCQDITVQKQLDRLKQDFVAMVSHDVRTPLSSITIFLEMVDDGTLGELSPDGANAIKSVISSSNELTQLIKDLLDIEKIQAASHPRQAIGFDLQQLDLELRQPLEELCQSREISLELDFPAKCYLNADKDKLSQALTTILLAAIKRAIKGSIVKLEAIAAGNQIDIFVDWQQDPSQPVLTQTDFATYHPHDNTVTLGGLSKLGLALSRTIIERVEGSLQLLSNQSSFRCHISLPSPKDTETSLIASAAKGLEVSP